MLSRHNSNIFVGIGAGLVISGGLLSFYFSKVERPYDLVQIQIRVKSANGEAGQKKLDSLLAGKHTMTREYFDSIKGELGFPESALHVVDINKDRSPTPQLLAGVLLSLLGCAIARYGVKMLIEDYNLQLSSYKARILKENAKIRHDLRNDLMSLDLESGVPIEEVSENLVRSKEVSDIKYQIDLASLKLELRQKESELQSVDPQYDPVPFTAIQSVAPSVNSNSQFTNQPACYIPEANNLESWLNEQNGLWKFLLTTKIPIIFHAMQGSGKSSRVAALAAISQHLYGIPLEFLFSPHYVAERSKWDHLNVPHLYSNSGAITQGMRDTLDKFELLYTCENFKEPPKTRMILDEMSNYSSYPDVMAVGPEFIRKCFTEPRKLNIHLWMIVHGLTQINFCNVKGCHDLIKQSCIVVEFLTKDGQNPTGTATIHNLPSQISGRRYRTTVRIPEWLQPHLVLPLLLDIKPDNVLDAEFWNPVNAIVELDNAVD